MVAEKELQKVEEIVQNTIKDQSLEEGDILINCLHQLQVYFHNFIPPEAAEKVAEMLSLPSSRVYEVLTFYTMFSTHPRGKYLIRFCDSLPCHVTGGKEVIDFLKKELGIEIGQTTSDQMFTLETTGCLGLCGVSPVLMINDEFYGNLTVERTKELIDRLRAGGEHS